MYVFTCISLLLGFFFCFSFSRSWKDKEGKRKREREGQRKKKPVFSSLESALTSKQAAVILLGEIGESFLLASGKDLKSPYYR